MKEYIFTKTHCFQRWERANGETRNVFPNRRLLPVDDESAWLDGEMERHFPGKEHEASKNYIIPILKGDGEGYLSSREDDDLGYRYMAAWFKEGQSAERDFFQRLEDVLLGLYQHKDCGYCMSFNISDVINTLRQCREAVRELKEQGRNASNWDLPF